MGRVVMIIVFVLFNICSLSFLNSASSSSLSVGFYDESCPRVEDIIYEELVKKMSPIPRNITIPGTLRLFFHDCSVQGCDGSVLILPTDANNSERNASINLSLAGDAFDIVDKAKAAQNWRGKDVKGFDVTSLLCTVGRSALGGFTHCLEFAKKIIICCPFPKIDRNVAEALDQTSEFVFDNNKFFKSLRERKGLLLTDHVLAFGENDLSRKLVYRIAKAMVKLGRVGVKTGNEGEIRRDCKKFN
ncbi:hypothetical protein MKX03_024346 [Papaver bracteatum]|nr:hypothetical protein MKX03_024346 [Papaver bracteatum]